MTDAERTEAFALYHYGVSQRGVARLLGVTKATIHQLLFSDEMSARKSKSYAAWYGRNAEKKRNQSKEYRASNNEAYVAAIRRWQKANPERVRLHIKGVSSRRRARLNNTLCEHISPAQLQNLVDGWDTKCAYCRVVLSNFELDHIVPVAAGGLHMASNLAPACLKCNRSKGAKSLSEWRDGKHAEFVPTHAAAIAAALRERR